MRAARRIAKGEVVLSVPINITFSAENAKQTDLRDVIETLKLDQYVSMALMLLQERSKGTASPYFPYVCKIPGTFETTIFWPFDKLEAATGSNYSNLYLQTVRMRAYLIRTYNLYMPLLFRLFPDRFSPHTHGIRDFTWAMTAVFSRNWGISDRRLPAVHWKPPARPGVRGPEQPSGYGNFSNIMVPVADLANHMDDDQGYIAFLDDGRSFGLIAGRDYEAGDEIFTVYGSDCNARYLVGYGFAPASPVRDRPCRVDLVDRLTRAGYTLGREPVHRSAP